MFLDKVLGSSVGILLFIIFLGKCIGSIQEKYLTSSTHQKMETEYQELLPNSKKYLYEEPEKGFKKIEKEGGPFIFRSQNFKESMEKIQTMDNGTITKSAYIPIISNGPILNHFDASRVLFDDENLAQKSARITSPEPKVPTSSIKENFVIKNGKKYRIVKVKKNAKNTNEKQPKDQMERRTFKPLPNLLSILPLKWLTRQRKNETKPETRSQNKTEWSKLMPVRNPDENSKEILQYGDHGSEKIKKLLNLFTIVKFENGECYANGIKGTCLHKTECEVKGGKFTATCAEDLGVCCYNEKTCGEISNDNCIYFINEGFPDSSTTAPKVCTLTLEKSNPLVKQLRLDFQIFRLKGPSNGTCLHDKLIVSGQNMNHVIPEICGSNTGQHIYVDISDSTGPFNLNIVTMGEYFPRNFRIKVTQVTNEDELLAPKNCLQYYSEPTGYVQTFNYQQDIDENVDEITNGYFNNLNYAICIKKQKGFCSITYENEHDATKQPTFQLVNIDEDGERLLPPRQAGAETFDCPDDYVIINGIRLCGEKLNDASIDIDYTRDYPVTDTTNGPHILTVRTDGTRNVLMHIQPPCKVTTWSKATGMALYKQQTHPTFITKHLIYFYLMKNSKRSRQKKSLKNECTEGTVNEGKVVSPKYLKIPTLK